MEGPDLSEHEPVADDHIEPDIKTLCAYCGRVFDIDEVVIEKAIHGRTWRFCNEDCLADFRDAADFRDDVDDDVDADKARDPQ